MPHSHGHLESAGCSLAAAAAPAPQSTHTLKRKWENGHSIKVTLHIYSFLLNLLFIQHLVSRETDEGPSALSRALQTFGLKR